MSACALAALTLPGSCSTFSTAAMDHSEEEGEEGAAAAGGAEGPPGSPSPPSAPCCLARISSLPSSQHLTCRGEVGQRVGGRQSAGSSSLTVR